MRMVMDSTNTMAKLVTKKYMMRFIHDSYS